MRLSRGTSCLHVQLGWITPSLVFLQCADTWERQRGRRGITSQLWHLFSSADMSLSCHDRVQILAAIEVTAELSLCPTLAGTESQGNPELQDMSSLESARAAELSLPQAYPRPDGIY